MSEINKIKEYSKNYYQKNKEKIKQYYQKNKDKKHQYYMNNRKRILAREKIKRDIMKQLIKNNNII